MTTNAFVSPDHALASEATLAAIRQGEQRAELEQRMEHRQSVDDLLPDSDTLLRVLLYRGDLTRGSWQARRTAGDVRYRVETTYVRIEVREELGW